ncbi:MAG: hypothetical protein JXB88_12975 [Spirochaetales bacterium]|nr:hypothetical protein [Spirochaetales bacterium]
MIKKRPALCVILLFLSAFFSYSLEVINGNIRLVLHENLGRFSVYYLEDPVNRKYTSYFLDQDVRTSVTSIVVDNKIFRLGESGSFKETAEETSNGARFLWESRQLEITEEFTFASSSGSGKSDCIVITLTLKNVSSNPVKSGVRYLFDTYLGESHNHHFKTNLTENMIHEIVIEKKNMVAYWISQDIKKENTGLQVITGISGVTAPDRIVFANWKRLNDTPWTYFSSDTRDFSSRPYSINDSAVCHYYDPVIVESGKSRKIILMMGKMNEQGYKDTDSVLEDTYSTLLTSADGDLPDKLKSDIMVLNNLLELIKKKIASGELITDKDISIMEQIIEEIKIHAENYQNE